MNTFTAVCNLCKAPEDIELGGRPCKKLRLADNTHGKNTETRFFDATVSGHDAETAARLESGDQVVITGTLASVSYKSKKGKNAGQTVVCDSMPFARILQVTRSKTFFAGLENPPPDVATGNDNPLADLL